MNGMTVTQRHRFTALSARLFKQTNSIFGGQIFSAVAGLEDDGIDFGEDVSRVMEVESRGVTYRIIISAGRADESELQ